MGDLSAYYDPHIRFARVLRSRRQGADESLAVTDTHLKTLLKAIDLDKTLVVLVGSWSRPGYPRRSWVRLQLYEEDILVLLVCWSGHQAATPAGPGQQCRPSPNRQQPPESSERRGRLGRSHAGAGDVRSKVAREAGLRRGAARPTHQRPRMGDAPWR